VIEQWSAEQLEQFARDGFVIVDGLIDNDTVAALRGRFEPLFAGRYATGIKPDEVNWLAGRDPEDRTRQICNGWKADARLAAQTLSAHTGRLAAELMGWDGVRIVQDNVIWKPPGAKSLGMHQDGSYLDYLVPPEMITCWIALDETSADSGPITYAAGSHRWPRSPENRGEFHAPADWLAPLERARGGRSKGDGVKRGFLKLPRLCPRRVQRLLALSIWRRGPLDELRVGRQRRGWAGFDPQPVAHVVIKAGQHLLEAPHPLLDALRLLFDGNLFFLRLLAVLHFERQLALLELEKPDGDDCESREPDRHRDGYDAPDRRDHETDQL